MKWPCNLLFCFSLAACGGDDARRSESLGLADFTPDERPLATTLVYECNGYEFVARLGPGEMALWLEDRYVILSQVRSASGTLYEEGDISFWSKGDEAMLTVAGQNYQNCHLLPERVPWEDARRRGVKFRAAGNEPGWYLEIQGGRQLLFVADYGLQRVMVSDPVEERIDPAHVYHGTTGVDDLRVVIVDVPCFDTMSGDAFPSHVEVTLNGVTYPGCGRSLDYPWEQ
jgi:membrane-bound inhibitor of C-type lysozyme